MKAYLGISDSHLHAAAEELNKLLADEIVLYVKIRSYYWNCSGIDFYEIHRFYESHFNKQHEMVHQVANRIRDIGHLVEACLVDYLRLTSLVELPYTPVHSQQLKNLMASHETMINSLRRLIVLFTEKLHDRGSANFATQLLVEHERMVTMVRAYLS